MSEAVAIVTADKVIDARGTACPGPLLEAKKAMGQVKVGQVIEVKSNDKGRGKILPHGPRRWATSFWASSKPRGMIASWCVARSSLFANCEQGLAGSFGPAGISLPRCGVMAVRGAV